MKQASPVYDAIILGAGASGLVCALTAAGRGKRVLVIDHAAKAGRKLSITGGGKCNLTNRRVEVRDYVGSDPGFCRSALARFGPDRALALAAAAGIGIEEREQGQLFCTRPASELADALFRACEQRGCDFALAQAVLEVTPSPDPAGARFAVRTSLGRYRCRNLVVALGGTAWPQVGATDRGYALARGLGHEVTALRPALCGLRMPPDWLLTGLSGISIPASIRVIPAAGPEQSGPVPGGRGLKKNAPVAEALPLLLTHKGISGPAALQASLYWHKGMGLEIDFLPGARADTLIDAPGAGKALCRSTLRKRLPDRLCDALVPEQLGSRKGAEMPRRDRDLLAAAIHRHTVFPLGAEGYAKAEVTAGGVRTDAVSSRSMESKRLPGLFFCGEVLDVTGRLGGYNLHWAFASGAAAGENIQACPDARHTPSGRCPEYGPVTDAPDIARLN